MVHKRIFLIMPQSEPAQFKPNRFEPACYSLEVIRIDGVQSESKIWKLSAEIEFDKTIHRTGEINNDGKPASATTVAFRVLVPYSIIKCDLPGTARSVFLRKRTVTIGSIHLCIDVVDALTRAELYVGMAERRVEEIRATTDRMVSADSVIGHVVQAVDQIIEIVDTLAQIRPVFNLSWKATSALYKLVSHQFKTDAKLVGYPDKMTEAFHFPTEALGLVDRTEMLKPTIKELLDETAKCSRAVQKYTSHGFIEEYATRFDDLRRKLFSVTDANTAKGVDNIELSSMDISKVSTRPRCLEGTCQDYVERTTSRLLVDTDTDQNIVWLTGAAGSGKSTIAVTISDICSDKGSPAAYLFFERGKDEYISTVWTIAYRLAVLRPSICPHVVNAMKGNNNVVGSPLKTQLKKLLLQPIHVAAKGIDHPIVIILDALDECGTDKQREDLVRLLTTDFKTLPSNVRVLVTSRPENDLLKAFVIERERMVSALEQGPPRGWTWDGICEVLSGDCNNPWRKLRALLDDIKLVGGGVDSLCVTVLEQSGISWHEAEPTDEFSRILGFILFAKKNLSGEDIEAFLGLEEDTVDAVLGSIRSVISYVSGNPVRLHHASFADYLTSERSSGKPWNIHEPTQKLAVAERCLDVMSGRLCFNICGIESSFLRNDEVPDLEERIKREIPSHLAYACHFWAVHLQELLHPDLLMVKLKAFANHQLPCWSEVLSLTKHHNRMAVGVLYNVSLKAASIKSSLVLLVGCVRTNKRLRIPDLVEYHFSMLHPIINVRRCGKKAPAQCIKLLAGYTSRVKSVVLSPDGKRIASGCDDRTIRIWDADSGEVVSGPLEGHTEWVRSVTFSPDGKHVASGSDDRTIRAWDASSGELVLEGHTFLVWSVSFSPDGSASHRALEIGQSGHLDGVTSVVLSPDGNSIASGSDDKTIRVCAYNGNLVAGPFEEHTDGVWSIDFSPDGGSIVSGSMTCHTGGIYSVVFSPDGGSIDKTICVWDSGCGELVAGRFKGHSSYVRSVVFSPNGNRTASGSHDNTIRIRDAESGTFSDETSERSGQSNSFSFSPGGKRIASGSDDLTVRVWDAETGGLVQGSSDGVICVWDAVSGERIVGPFEAHTSSVMSVVISPDGRFIASGSTDMSICIWDTDGGKLVAGRLWGIQAKSFASRSDDKAIRIRDANSGGLVSAPLVGHAERIWSVAYFPDGKRIVSGSTDKIIKSRRSGSRRTGTKYLVSGSGDKSVRIWTVDSGQLATGPLRAIDGVWSVAIFLDGKQLASGSLDGTIRVWKVNIDEE
ncbi:hypothetical protein ACEPAF_5618 [Sanghuangporus sanghuang]